MPNDSLVNVNVHRRFVFFFGGAPRCAAGSLFGGELVPGKCVSITRRLNPELPWTTLDHHHHECVFGLSDLTLSLRNLGHDDS